MTKIALVACVVAVQASAQTPPNYGFDFVTIGDLGNKAFVGDLLNDDPQFLGRGSVDYEYRISKTEIRTSDWVEFSNLAPQFTSIDTSFGASHWGAQAVRDPKTGNEIWVQLSAESGNYPVAGISWWAAATYANWLHNDKALTPEAFQSGAYDLSTFGFNNDTGYTDQATRSPGAKYWIPSVDEWLKAAHYDPNKEEPGEGGWWVYPNGSDTKPVTGIPGVGETSADLFELIGDEAWQTPVGSYPKTQSPWGLLDVSGGASEWLEDWLFPDDFIDRVTDGTSIDTVLGGLTDPDRIGIGNIASTPDLGRRNFGLRLASAIPAPSSAVLVGVFVLGGGIRRRR